MSQQNFIQISESFIIDTDYLSAFKQIGLSSIEDVFAFNTGQNLAKKNLASHRSRLQFSIGSQTFFLKRYDTTPISVQLKNWLSAGKRRTLALSEIEPAAKLQLAGINTPKTVCYGQTCGTIFEKQSFSITEKIPKAHSLEQKLPDFFYQTSSHENIKKRKDFLAKLAAFIKRFHNTGFRHRDLYLCHIFINDKQQFFLIDLARAFKPKFRDHRYRIKDLAQLYYSAPKKFFTKTDRLLFFLNYIGSRQLTPKDKTFMAKVIKKAAKMAKHDEKHGRPVPFAK